jgi:N-acetylglucosaminyldiphosphoundecaprenol N-acetyl-beta-D-mannosaminyltransferase
LKIPHALEAIQRLIKEGKPSQINFANAYTLSIARKDASFREILNRSTLTLADGMSIVWGARWLNLHFPERLAGPDMMEWLCEEAAAKNQRVFLMGSSWDNLTELKNALVSRHPKLQVVGMHSPPMRDQFSEEETATILRDVHKAKPDILFVGISCPKQEKWISQNLQALGVPVCLAVGAAFDFLSGRIPRAPERLRNVGLEWLYRLWCEPRRLWKRYLLGNAIYLSWIGKEWLRIRFSGGNKE